MSRTSESPPGRVRVDGPLIAVLVLLLAGCGGDGGTDPDPRVGAVQVQASRTTLEIGESLQLAATVLDQTGAVLSGQPVTWSTSAESVATVSTGGMVTAVGAGTAEIEATAEGISGSVVLTVNSAPCSEATIQGAVAAGQSRTGTLGGEDCIVFENGPYGEGWEITLTQQRAVLVEVTTSEFQPVALITDLDFNFLGFAIAPEIGEDARLMYPLDPGRYLVWAASFDSGEIGDFQLSYDEGPLVECDAPVGTLTLPDTVAGSLDFGTCLSDLVGFGDPWRLSMTQTTTVRLDLSSPDFDAVVVVTDASGEVVAFDDDSGGDFNASLVVSLGAGEYTVWAASFRGTELGDYSLAGQVVTGGGGAVAGNWSPFRGPSGDDRPGPRVKSPAGWGPFGGS